MTGRHVNRARAAGFTLVEMLVVIVIIGILASLTTVAVTAALDKAHQTQIQVELNQISAAFERYKNEYGSYPPNCDPSNVYGYGALDPKKKDAIRAAIRRHVRKAFPRSLDGDISGLFLTPDEAIVFWLGGFSSNPERPFTGPGGPTYRIDERTNALMEFDQSRLGPPDKNDDGQPAFRTNDFDFRLYNYRPPKVEEPYVYFNTSRLDADPNSISGNKSPAYLPDYRGYRWEEQLAPKEPQTNEWSRGVPQPLLQSNPPGGTRQYVNPKSFQILAAGTDGEWEDVSGRESSGSWEPDPDGWPAFPNGPFLGARADNLCNFSTTRLEDSQP